MQKPLLHGLLQKAKLDALSLPYRIFQLTPGGLSEGESNPRPYAPTYINAQTRVGPICVAAFVNYQAAEDYLLSKLTQEGWDECRDMHPGHTEA